MLAWWANLDNSALSLRHWQGIPAKSNCFSQESSLRAGKSVDSSPQKRFTESAVSAEMDWRLEGSFFTVQTEEHPGWKLRFVGRRGFVPECPVLLRGVSSVVAVVPDWCQAASGLIEGPCGWQYSAKAVLLWKSVVQSREAWMSVIRFLHTDSLRLGSPVVGLSESPEWLRRTSAAAVRQAVTNLVDLAIAVRSHFVLIAGRLTESADDLEPAVTWLCPQVQRLAQHGIVTVVAGHDVQQHAALSRLNAILLSPGQWLSANLRNDKTAELLVGSGGQPSRGDLRVDVGLATRGSASMVYSAMPGPVVSGSLQSADGSVVAHQQYLRLTAGPVQALDLSERGPCGCVVVEADVAQQKLVGRFCATDVLRFVQELVVCPAGTRPSELLQKLMEHSRRIASRRCVTLAEWIVDGAFLADGHDEQSILEADLLRDLRQGLNAGHSGAWPCRIRFSERSQLDMQAGQSLLLRSLAGVIHERRQRTGSAGSGGYEFRGLPLGQGSEVAEALSVLRRVA
jgi:hypothetical protein